MNKFIFTASPLSQQMAYNEIKANVKGANLVSYISPGIGLVETPLTFNEVSNIFNTKLMVFTRHILPVTHVFNIFKPEDILNNIDTITDVFIKNVEVKTTFSVQTRIYTKEEPIYKKSFLNDLISISLVKQGFLLDVKKSDNILSLIVTDANMFVGVSTPIQNLSYWPGGEYRFKKDDNLISRAEFKLLEALDVFNIEIKNHTKALDLGAAPGGWTKVLLDSNLKVTCVDPANLSDKIKNNKNVTHYKCLAQDFLKEDHTFDIIVNDMRMDIYESISLMESATRYLNKSNGIAIMTLKLREKNIQTQVNKALNIISKSYTILHARQLFHNRSEVTLVLAPLN